MAGGTNPAEVARTTSESHHQNVRSGVRRANFLLAETAERLRRVNNFLRSAESLSLTTVCPHQSHGTPVDTLCPLFEPGQIARGH